MQDHASVFWVALFWSHLCCCWVVAIFHTHLANHKLSGWLTIMHLVASYCRANSCHVTCCQPLAAMQCCCGSVSSNPLACTVSSLAGWSISNCVHRVIHGRLKIQQLCFKVLELLGLGFSTFHFNVHLGVSCTPHQTLNLVWLQKQLAGC